MIARLRALSKGTSLLELLSLATIIGIIAVCLVPYAGNADERIREELDRKQRQEINTAIERWYLANGTWPSEDLSELGHDPRYFPAGLPQNPVTGQPYVFHEASRTAH